MRLYLPEKGGRRQAAALRWGAAGLVAAGLHLAAGWWLVSHAFQAAPPPEQAMGIPIDLEPVAVPQNAPEPTSAAAAGPAPAPQAAAAPDLTPTPDRPAAEPQPEPAPAPPEPPQPAPEPQHQVTEAAPPPPEPTPRPVPEEVQPAPVQPPPGPAPVSPPKQEATSDAVLAAPPQPPRPRLPPKPDPRVLAREAAQRKAVAEKRERERVARQEARTAARAQARAAQARDGGGEATPSTAPSSASSGADVASWRGAVVAHLNGFKPAANGAAGTARVAFAVDRGGRVVSASLVGSSGDPQLDSAAVAMVRRASPVPAPPAELGGRIDLTVPVRFH